MGKVMRLIAFTLFALLVLAYAWSESTEADASTAAPISELLQAGSDFVVADMHDGDKKRLTFHDFTKESTGLTIRPYGNNQTWVVETTMSNTNNEAVVDFNVPNKPSPPPVNLTLSLKMLNGIKMVPGKVPRACVFTDPSGTLAAKDYPLNVWVELDT